MRVDCLSSNSFGAIHYLRMPMPVAGEKIGSPTLSSIVDNNPPKTLKKIVEGSDFFQSLGKATDVFISTQRMNYQRNLFKEFTAIFMDPYDKSKVTPDEFNIQLNSPNEEVFYDKLDVILTNLPPTYDGLKSKYKSSNPRVILDIENMNWFITQGRSNLSKVK